MTVTVKHDYERGQAIVEMGVALLAICAVFLGVIFMLAVGQTNIENTISARSEADRLALNDLGGGSGVPIRFWIEGRDGRMFTNDDEEQIITYDDPELFQGELASGGYNLSTDLPAYAQNNFSNNLGDEFLFLDAADLTGTTNSSDPFQYMAIEDLRGAFRALIFDGDVIIQNTVYMPVFGRQED